MFPVRIWLHLYSENLKILLSVDSTKHQNCSQTSLNFGRAVIKDG